MVDHVPNGPGTNWVQKAGGLPAYIDRVAGELILAGMAKDKAIATAVATMKRWAAGGGKVSAKTQAKAAAAVAEWEALRARAKAQRKAGG